MTYAHRRGAVAAHGWLALAIGMLLANAMPQPAHADAANAAGKTRAAQAREQEDARSLRELIAEGELLYGRDRVKLNGYQYCSQSVALADRGELRESIRAAAKALLLAQDGDDRNLQGLARRDLAIAYSYAGDLERAESFARQALDLSDGNLVGIAAPAHKVIGDVRARRGKYDAALEAYYESLALASDKFRPLVQLSIVNALLGLRRTEEADAALQAVGQPKDAALQPMILRTRGNLRLAQGRAQEALQLFRSGLKLAGGTDAAYQRLWLTEGVARSKLELNDRTGALAAYREAVQMAEQVRARFRSEEFKTGLFGDTQRIFEEAIALAAASGDYEEALRISERSRARALLDMVRERTNGSVGVEAAALVVEPAALRASLREDEALIEYHVLSDRTVAWLVERDGLRGVTVPVARDELVRGVEQLRESITRIDSTTRRRALLFHRALIEPLGLREGTRLVIVPHGPLHYLPFQALFDGSTFLIERHPVAVAPSASVAYQATVARRRGEQVLVAFGNPDLGQADMALPGAQREVEAISGLFATRQVYLQEQATKARFLGTAAQADVLHVAAHAQVDAVDPIYSRVLLAPGESDDGRLEAREVFDLDLSGVRLVTLSACESGLGKVQSGDEIIGFTRSFLSAGVSGLIVSLWPVSDESTSILMTTLYRDLKAGRSVQDAMRSGQLAVLKESRFSHPFFWAPFNLIGDWRMTVSG
jgi:CHAT domain-containing protein/predicted negative regulator of RcsB-dependent stress response